MNRIFKMQRFWRARRVAPLRRDPFSPCTPAWAHNILAAVGPRLYDRGVARAFMQFEMIKSLLAGLRPPDADEDEDEDRGESAAQLTSYLERTGRRRLTPAPPAEPVASGVATVSELLGLNDLERRILTFALALTHSQRLEDLTSQLGELHLMMRELIGAAVNAPPGKLRAALAPNGRLCASGILTFEGDSLESAELAPKEGLMELLLTPGLDRKKVVERYLPEAPPPTLRDDDFTHLETEVALLERLLAKAVEKRRRGINVLLHGPSGVGKTELARLLARKIGVPVYAAGMADQQGLSAATSERLSSLMLGHKLLRAAPALLLFDELEDVFVPPEMTPWRATNLVSKQWYGALLETNPVPTIWVSNEVRQVDPAYLRRFTYALPFPPLGARQRERILRRHLGRGHGLEAAKVAAIAERFEAAPGQFASAAASARLITGGRRVEAALLEHLLASGVTLTTGRDPLRVQPDFDPTRYRPGAVNASEDVEALAERLRGWTPEGGGLTMVLYGPPGTGKSEYVRYLAWRMGRRLVVRRGSDIFGPYVGQTEARIAEAFAEAERDDAVLLFDEVDSFLRTREQAARSWEVSFVNEFLQQLERFQGVVACTTNLWGELDPAALRRFVFKIEVRPLRAEQALVLFEDVLGRPLETGERPEVLRRLGALAMLTPGDLATIGRNLRILGETVGPEALLERVEREVALKGGAGRPVGFGA